MPPLATCHPSPLNTNYQTRGLLAAEVGGCGAVCPACAAPRSADPTGAGVGCSLACPCVGPSVDKSQGRRCPCPPLHRGRTLPAWSCSRTCVLFWTCVPTALLHLSLPTLMRSSQVPHHVVCSLPLLTPQESEFFSKGCDYDPAGCSREDQQEYIQHVRPGLAPLPCAQAARALLYSRAATMQAGCAISLACRCPGTCRPVPRSTHPRCADAAPAARAARRPAQAGG